MLDYHTTGRVKCTFELGKLDIIHHTKLEKVAHKLGSRSHEVDKRVGRVFIPRNESHVTYDYGVIRYDEPVMAKHRHLLKEINFDLILAFLCKHGQVDTKRDQWNGAGGWFKQTLRISCGTADHNYEYRHADKVGRRTPWNILRDLPRYDCFLRQMLEFDAALPGEIGKLMDLQALVLFEKLEGTNRPVNVLRDGFILTMFTEPFVNFFGCKHALFPCIDLVSMDTQQALEADSGTYHEDDSNGTTMGNDISSTLSIFFGQILYLIPC